MVPGTDRLKLIASAVYPVSGPAILNGAVLIDEDGRIAAVGSAADVPHPEGAATLHLPDALVMPGLVNLHTHLELTTMGAVSYTHLRAHETDPYLVCPLLG